MNKQMILGGLAGLLVSLVWGVYAVGVVETRSAQWAQEYWAGVHYPPLFVVGMTSLMSLVVGLFGDDF